MFLVILSIPTNEINANVTIPDANFKACLNLKLEQGETDPITQLQLEGMEGTLNCNSKNISDIDGAQYLTGIEWIYLTDNQISDVSPLKNLTQLTILTLDSNNISDISDLGGLTNLSNLSLNNNQVSNVGVVGNLSNLTKLGLGSNSISDINALKDLTNLTFLNLDGHGGNDISAISNLTNLDHLVLGQNNLTDISALSELVNVTKLTLNNNNITDISALEKLTKLNHLNLTSNQISDISVVSNLVNLNQLFSDRNQISDLNPVKDLQELTIFSVAYNQVSDVSMLNNLAKLEYLYVHNNQISDISALSGLSNLQNFVARAQNITLPDLVINNPIYQVPEIAKDHEGNLVGYETSNEYTFTSSGELKYIIINWSTSTPVGTNDYSGTVRQYVTYQEPTLTIDANNFSIHIDELDDLTTNLAKTKANVVSSYGTEDLKSVVTVDADEYNIIKNTNEEGVYDLTFSVEKNGVTEIKTVKVSVISDDTVEINSYMLNGSDFEIDSDDVVNLDIDGIISMSNATAWNRDSGSVATVGVVANTVNVDAGIYPVKLYVKEDSTVTTTINVTVVDTTESISLDASNFVIHINELEDLTKEDTKVRANVVSNHGSENITQAIEVDEVEYEVIKNTDEVEVYDLTFRVERDGSSVEKTVSVTVVGDELPTTGNVNYIWIFPLIIIALYIARKYVVNRKNM